MNRRHRRPVMVLGVLGGGLGVASGLAQATVGSSIPQWSGDKASPLALGLLTVALSLLSVWCARTLGGSGEITDGRRLAAVAGLIVPGLLCFSTVGNLWFVPGALLLLTAAVALRDGRGLGSALAASWMQVLVSVLGAAELVMAVSAGRSAVVVLGVVGGAALMAAPWVRHPLPLLLVGTIPFAVLTWASLVSPLLSVVALTIAFVVHNRGASPGPNRRLVGV